MSNVHCEDTQAMIIQPKLSLFSKFDDLGSHNSEEQECQFAPLLPISLILLHQHQHQYLFDIYCIILQHYNT